MSEPVIIDGELNLENNIDGLPNEQIIVNVTGAPKIIDKASGKIVSIVDGAENEKLLSAVVNIEPVQSGSGDPSPTNIRPISGWSEVKVTRAGENLFDKATGAKNLYVGGVNGATTGAGGTLLCFYAKKGVQYTLNATGGNRTNLFYYDTSSVDDIVIGLTLTLVTRSAAKPYTFIAEKDAVYCYYANTDYDQSIADSCTVNVGSVVLPYSPYQGTTATIPLGRTVYGCTLDMVRGKLNAKPYYASYSGQTLVGPWISSHDKYVAVATPTTGAQVVDMGAAGTDYDVTPQTIKTLLGTNNIWADAGSMEVEYVADTKLYIQRLTAPTEDDMIANENIASGKFFMVGNDLYMSTAAIVAGETIAPGTNCTKLSLAEALNNINA